MAVHVERGRDLFQVISRHPSTPLGTNGHPAQDLVGFRRPSLPLIALTLVLACGRSTPITELPGVVRSPDPNVIVDPRLQHEAPPGCIVTAVEDHPLAPFARKPIDVLLVIDNSCSMGDDQQQLAANFSAFMSSFQSKQVDFHVGAVTTDMEAITQSGRLVAPFLTRSTPNLERQFAAMVSQGTSGSPVEMALGATSAALTPPLSTSVNSGFVRDGADLGLVIIGDEDDQSGLDVASLANTVRTLKGNSAVTVAAAIGLSSGWTCWDDSVAHWRIAQFASEFGSQGLVAVCRDDWATMLRSIAGRIVSARCIVGLSRPLDPHKRVHVTVNGQPATFVENAPEPAFPHGSIEVDPCPEAGGTVHIGYDDCD